MDNIATFKELMNDSLVEADTELKGCLYDIMTYDAKSARATVEKTRRKLKVFQLKGTTIIENVKREYNESKRALEKMKRQQEHLLKRKAEAETAEEELKRLKKEIADEESFFSQGSLFDEVSSMPSSTPEDLKPESQDEHLNSSQPSLGSPGPSTTQDSSQPSLGSPGPSTTQDDGMVKSPGKEMSGEQLNFAQASALIDEDASGLPTTEENK